MFQEVEDDQAYLKMGIMGLQGSGKTRTACNVAIGLHNLLKERGLPGGDQPVFMHDTETGSTWLKPLFAEAGITFKSDKTKSFKSLVEGIEYVAQHKAILIVDSITHFWIELQEAYAEKKHRKFGLQFQDWATIKGSKLWGKFTNLLVNSESHIIMCGRQGWNYDHEEVEGKRTLVKTDVKMKAEAETGYEPSLLVLMERHQELNSHGGIEKAWRTGMVLKDRSDTIDGSTFENPTFEDFLPHIGCLNLGGKHQGVDLADSSEGMIESDDHSFRNEMRDAEIEREEILELIKKHYPSQTTDDKAYRADLMEEFFQTRSWKKVETLDLAQLRIAHNALHKKLEGKPKYPDMEPPEDKF